MRRRLPVANQDELLALLATLRAAKAKIARKRHWTTGAHARDERGDVVAAASQSAERWCMVGAVEAVATDDTKASALDALNRVTGGGKQVGAFNDKHRHDDALAAFDRAIRFVGMGA